MSLGQRFSSATIKGVGLLQQDGSIIQLVPATPGPSDSVPGALHYSLPAPADLQAVQAVGVVVKQVLPGQIADPQQALVAGVGVNSSKGYFALNGELEPYLTYPHFHPLGTSSSLSIFENSSAQPILKTDGPQTQILSLSTALNGTLRLRVASSGPSSISWAEAYAPGWQAKYTSATTGHTFHIPVGKDGTLQSIPVPAGKWNITVFYHPDSVYVGIWISLATIWGLFAYLSQRYLRGRKPRKSADSFS